MAYNFSMRARKLAWSFSDDKDTSGIAQIRRVGTDSTLNDDDDDTNVSTSIQRLGVNEDIDTFVAAIRKDGCVLIDNFTDLNTIRQALQDAERWLLDDSVPLIKRSATIRNTFFANDIYQGLCDDFLTIETATWKDDRLEKEVCQPAFSSASTKTLRPASPQSKITRYDSVLGIKHERVNKYRQGRDSMLGLLIPSIESVQVHAALGSHLYGHGVHDFGKELVEEQVQPGQALVVLGSLYHYVAAQPERQESAAPALVHAIWSSAGIYRPEDHSASMISAAEVQTYPEVVRERLR